MHYFFRGHRGGEETSDNTRFFLDTTPRRHPIVANTVSAACEREQSRIPGARQIHAAMVTRQPEHRALQYLQCTVGLVQRRLASRPNNLLQLTSDKRLSAQ